MPTKVDPKPLLPYVDAAIYANVALVERIADFEAGAAGDVVPMPTSPLPTKKRELLPIMKLMEPSNWLRAVPGDVVDAVFVGDVVEALELAERVVLVVEEHAGVASVAVLPSSGPRSR